MMDGECLVFVEVRYRNSDRFGGGLASIDQKKQNKLRASAQHYRQRAKQLSNRPCRFDVISITGNHSDLTPEWIRDAF